MKYDAYRLWCRHEMRTNLIALYRSLSYCQWGDTNRSDPLPVRSSGYFQALSNSWTRDHPEQIRGVARTGIISGLRGFHVHLKPHSCSPYLAWSWRIVKTNRAFYRNISACPYFSSGQKIQMATGPLRDATRMNNGRMLKLPCVTAIIWPILQY